MKKAKLEDYELFYMEIPQADYLSDIDSEIEDLHETASDNFQGLSDAQVSEIARDQLGNNSPQSPSASSEDEQSLFSPSSDTNG